MLKMWYTQRNLFEANQMQLNWIFQTANISQFTFWNVKMYDT